MTTSDNQLPSASTVDVDQIIKEIRQDILRREQRKLGVEPRDVNLVGEGLSPDFYASIYRAEMMYRDLSVDVEIEPSGAPVIGSLIDRLKRSLHGLVRHYVNLMLAEQVQFNRYLIQLVSRLSVELEEVKRDQAEHQSGTDSP